MADTGTPQSEPVQPSKIDQAMEKVNRGVRQFASLVDAAEKPLPTDPKDGEDDADLLKEIESGLKTLSHLRITDLQTLVEVQAKKMTGALWNDKEYLMESLIQTAARLGDSAPGQKVTDGFLAALYNDLQHPPIS
jgi:ABC-type transporter Mla subunit MlaD